MIRLIHSLYRTKHLFQFMFSMNSIELIFLKWTKQTILYWTCSCSCSFQMQSKNQFVRRQSTYKICFQVDKKNYNRKSFVCVVLFIFYSEMCFHWLLFWEIRIEHLLFTLLDTNSYRFNLYAMLFLKRNQNIMYPYTVFCLFWFDNISICNWSSIKTHKRISNSIW